MVRSASCDGGRSLAICLFKRRKMGEQIEFGVFLTLARKAGRKKIFADIMGDEQKTLNGLCLV